MPEKPKIMIELLKYISEEKLVKLVMKGLTLHGDFLSFIQKKINELEGKDVITMRSKISDLYPFLMKYLHLFQYIPLFEYDENGGYPYQKEYLKELHEKEREKNDKNNK